MHSIAVIGQKGGAGKTTVAIHLAQAAKKDGRSVAIIDLDPQGSASQWGAWRNDPGLPVIPAPADRLGAVLDEARLSGLDLIVIDTPPSAEPALHAAIGLADLAVIPTRPSAFDLHALQTTAAVARRWRCPTFVILNGVPPRATKLLDEVAMVVAHLGLSLAPVCLMERAAFRHAAAEGRSALEFEPDGKAAAEMRGVYTWTCERLGLRPTLTKA